MAKKKMLTVMIIIMKAFSNLTFKKSLTSAVFSQSYSFESVQLLLLCDNLLSSGSQSVLL